jgi:hypothetical protein
MNKFGTNDPQVLEDKLDQIITEAKAMNATKTALDKKAVTRANVLLYMGASIMVSQFAFITGGTYLVFSWDVMEPLAYLMSMTNMTVAFSYFLLKKQDMDLVNLRQSLTEKYSKKLYKKRNFDIKRFEELEEDIKELKGLINKCA